MLCTSPKDTGKDQCLENTRLGDEPGAIVDEAAKRGGRGPEGIVLCKVVLDSVLCNCEKLQVRCFESIVLSAHWDSIVLVVSLSAAGDTRRHRYTRQIMQPTGALARLLTSIDELIRI